jgi:hypothetical protein
MPQYMLLIYLPGEAPPPREAAESELPRWLAYTQALRDANALVSDNALQPVETATTVRVRSGETMLADGPFAETDEVLSGYYVIDVADLDAALGWAARIPSAPRGSVEVRPIMVFPDGDAPGAP